MPYSSFKTLPFLLLLSSLTLPVTGQTKLGFDLGNASIPVDAIHRGGPPPDGIPSIDEPKFTPAAEVNYLEAEDTIIAFEKDGVARAYPFRILIWHEIVNDRVAGQAIAVVYCPLCGTAMVFDRRYGDQTLDFGVSGLLYNSDVLMFDRQTKSLWSQLGMKAVAGKFVGTELEWLPSEQTTWAAWKAENPEGEVLNLDTGHRRDYRNLPYQSYFKSPRTMFPYQQNRDELEPKTWVAGIRINGIAKAYPIESMPDGKWIDDRIGETDVRVRYSKADEHFEARTDAGEKSPSSTPSGSPGRPFIREPKSTNNRTMTSKIKMTLLPLLAATLGSFATGAQAATPTDAREVNPVEVGSTAPDVTLRQADGEELGLHALTADQPVILVFYRGGWCPYCNRHL
ncbi:MAG TPA: DUF3179 domain-containing (seleno)protein, partial [Opitutales bacterium]|nr:DUF3179 domain-containing (seleno)protein [Opitutales bacterium]